MGGERVLLTPWEVFLMPYEAPRLDRRGPFGGAVGLRFRRALRRRGARGLSPETIPASRGRQGEEVLPP